MTIEPENFQNLLLDPSGRNKTRKKNQAEPMVNMSFSTKIVANRIQLNRKNKMRSIYHCIRKCLRLKKLN